MDLRRGSGSLAVLFAVLAVPDTAVAAACRDEADRLSARHQLDAAPAPAPSPVAAAPPRDRARDHITAARKADDDGIVEECLRQLAQARLAIEQQNGDDAR
jgi:hypothetical protein